MFKTHEMHTMVFEILLKNSENVVYSLATGTLLGALRHGAMIPYDYDLDIVVSLPLSVAQTDVCPRILIYVGFNKLANIDGK